jgi:formylglycine-generating enzyme required for sulfatase activity
MSGNLWEWTWDVADGGAWAEEAGGFAEGPDRVYRTGSWAGTLQHIQRRRSPGRNFYMPVVRSNSLGFRLVRTAP